jgi:hypothetical protein
MKKLLEVVLLFILACSFVCRANAQSMAPKPANASPAFALTTVPLSFEANQGQTDNSVKFLSRGDGYALFLTAKEAVFKLRKGADVKGQPSILRMELLGANEAAQVSGADQLTGTVNYFIGKDPTKWHSGVPTYGKVNYRGIYPGVDAVFYGNQRQLEYDFTVAPGADASRIAMTFTGARPKLDRGGNVLMSLGGETVTLHKPVLYQGEGANKKGIDGSYVVAHNRVHLRIGPYDHSQPLVIDPVISYLTYLGGSTGTNDNGNVAVTSISCRPGACYDSDIEGQGVAVDSAGNLYVTGLTYAVDFPTQNPLQATNGSATQWTAYVTKLNSTGSGLIYSTYLGGSGPDEAYAIAVDANDNAYVAGMTFSGNFPTTPGAYVSQCPVQAPGPPVLTYCQSSSAGFLTKLAPDGQSLVYSTYLVTPSRWNPILTLAVDSQGQAYVAGNTIAYCSGGFGCFPETANALLPESLFDQVYSPHTFNPGSAFLTVFSADGSSLVYSTLFGDSNPSLYGGYGNQTLNWTKATGVAVDPAGNFYLSGNTADPNLPVTPNAFQPNLIAPTNVSRSYIAKFSPTNSTGGPQLIYCTYLGSTTDTLNAVDEITGIVADASGSAYVTGLTQNPGFPTTPGSFNPGPCGAQNAGYCAHGAFLTKLKPDGTGLVWSTLLGYTNAAYNGIDEVLPPRLDALGNIYVEVSTFQGYPVVNPVQTFTDSNLKVGITKFDPTGSTVFFSTLLGSPTGSSQYGASNQFPAGVDVDPQGNIYVGGMTNGGDLVTTPGAFQPNFPLTSQNDSGFLAKIYPFVTSSTGLLIVPSSVNVGDSVTFTATVAATVSDPPVVTIPTGTVNFNNGATLLGTATLDPTGVGTFSTSTLPAGVYSVTAAYVGDNTFAPSTSGSQSLTVNGLASQTITFGALPSVTYGVSPITLGATASSGLPVSYSVTGPAKLSGSALTVTGVGTVNVTASQTGNSTYAAATPVMQSFVVSPAVLTVTASNASMTYGQPLPSFTYTAVGFVNGDTAAVLSGAPVETTTATSTSAPGNYTITITQGTLAAANYTFAFVNGTLTINGGASQTITFGGLPNVTYGVSPITLGATASSGLPVSYSVTGPASLSGSILTITGAGQVSVKASQAGNADYAAATPVTQSFTVSPAVLTATASNASMTYGQPIPSFTYTAAGFVNGDTAAVLSGAPAESTTATSTSAPGSYTITITQGTLAAANYTFAFVNGTLTINGGASQTITFGGLPNVTYGVSPITLGATASSGLPVSYSVTGPAKLSGSVLTVTGIGTVSVTASQAGNADYGAATPVTQSFTVSPAVLTVTASNASMTYGQPIPKFTYTASGFVNGDATAVLSGAPAESTTATSTSAPGNYTITITQGTLAAANYTFAFVNGTLTINAATQTITFNAIAAQTVGATVSLSASASSGLPVSFASLTPAVCTVTGTTASMVAAGTCSIQASQSGNADYLAASPVTQSFTVTVSSGAGFTITPNPKSETVARGVVAAFLLDLNSVNGFTGNVKLTCSGGPTGDVCVDLPQTVYLNKTAYAISGILFPKNTNPGTYTITFTGTSGSLTATATAQFTVK